MRYIDLYYFYANQSDSTKALPQLKKILRQFSEVFNEFLVRKDLGNFFVICNLNVEIFQNVLKPFKICWIRIIS